MTGFNQVWKTVATGRLPLYVEIARNNNPFEPETDN
jgi:hypothetical protein